MLLAGLEADTQSDIDCSADDLRDVVLARTDPRAFAPLYNRYVGPIYLYCLRQLHNPQEAEDATSHVFTRALVALPRFHPRPSDRGSTFRAWLYTIARNVVIDSLRKRRPQASVDDTTIDHRWLTDTSPGPEDLAIQADDAARLHALLDRLPERQRAVIELRLSGLNGPEIATALDLTISAVKSLQVRAYRHLRQNFDPDSPVSDEVTP